MQQPITHLINIFEEVESLGQARRGRGECREAKWRALEVGVGRWRQLAAARGLVGACGSAHWKSNSCLLRAFRVIYSFRLVDLDSKHMRSENPFQQLITVCEDSPVLCLESSTNRYELIPPSRPVYRKAMKPTGLPETPNTRFKFSVRNSPAGRWIRL